MTVILGSAWTTKTGRCVLTKTIHKTADGRLQWVWRSSRSLGSSATSSTTLRRRARRLQYVVNFDDETQQVNDDPSRHDYNVDQWVDKFMQDAREQSKHTLTLHQLWACGTDFQYQADRVV